MPELPDVEVFRRHVNSTSLRRRIRNANVRDTRLLKGVTNRRFAQQLKGKSFTQTRRHGKHLAVKLSGGPWLLLHFGMTGAAQSYSDEEDEPPFTRAKIELTGGRTLGIISRRRLGSIGLTDDFDQMVQDNDLGPDALDIDLNEFRRRLEGRSGSIKAALMDQSVLAGLGNVYTDETLYQAGIDPRRNVSKLSDRDIRSIHTKLRHVLHTAIERKADPEAVPRTWLLPHRHAGEPCPRCGSKIKAVTVSGRRGYMCPSCQR